jgi:hypothetical protein
MRILTLSVGGRQPIIVFGRRLEWSGPVARLAAIFVLFFWKMQLELRGQPAFAQCRRNASAPQGNLNENHPVRSAGVNYGNLIVREHIAACRDSAS